LLDDG
jgi:hypothetical protein